MCGSPPGVPGGGMTGILPPPGFSGAEMPGSTPAGGHMTPFDSASFSLRVGAPVVSPGFELALPAPGGQARSAGATGVSLWAPAGVIGRARRTAPTAAISKCRILNSSIARSLLDREKARPQKSVSRQLRVDYPTRSAMKCFMPLCDSRWRAQAMSASDPPLFPLRGFSQGHRRSQRGPIALPKRSRFRIGSSRNARPLAPQQ